VNSNNDSATHGLEEDDWKDLLERIEDKNCAPILGSGALTGGPPQGVEADGWHFQYPLGASLAQALAKDFCYPLDDCTRIERVTQFISVKRDPSLAKARIARELAKASPPDFTFVNEPHRVLAELKLPVYLTSNFDDYLVRALRAAEADVRVSICRWNKHIPQTAPAYHPDRPAQRDFPYVVAQEGLKPGTLAYKPETDALYEPSPANPLVYHFHGHSEWPASLVVTEDDYFEFLVNLSKQFSFILPRIQQVFGEGSLLFLGYTLDDWDFRVLFRLLADTFRNTTFTHIAVQLGPMSGAPTSDTTKAKDAARFFERYFGLRHIKIYWGTCQQFIAELKRRRE
jgi:hypothetical protein